MDQFTPFSHDEFRQRYYVHRVSALAVVLNRKNEILLAKQYRMGKIGWSLPGGLLEADESIYYGVIREVEEETGIKIKPVGILAVNNWAGKSVFKSDDSFHQGIGFIVGALIESGNLKPDGEEVFEVNFFSVEDVRNFSMHIKLYYEKLLNKNYLKLSEKSIFENAQSFRFSFL